MDRQKKSSDDATIPEEFSTLLREDRESIDAATLSKLNRARQTALAEMDQRSGFSRPAFWVPAGAAALLAVFVIGLAPNLMNQTEPAAPTAEAAKVPDLEMMLADESLDLMEELDFYLWLEDEQTGQRLPDNRATLRS